MIYLVENGIVKLERKLLERSDKSGCILHLPKFVRNYGEKVEIEIDTINKVAKLKFLKNK